MKKLIGLFLVVMMVFSVVPAFAEGGIDLGSLDYIDSEFLNEKCIKCGGSTSKIIDLENTLISKKALDLSTLFAEIQGTVSVNVDGIQIDDMACRGRICGKEKCGYKITGLGNIPELKLAYDSESLKNDIKIVANKDGKHDELFWAVKDAYFRKITNVYIEETVGEKTYYFYKNLFTQLGISEEDRLFFIKDQESLVLGQASGKDLYVNEITDSRSEYCIDNKIKISSLYTDGLSPCGGSGSIVPNNNNMIGNENFWVCDSCAKCDACEKTVASSGSDTILAIYCPEHVCDFFWNVNTGTGIEGLCCKDGKKVGGCYFCEKHKCRDCDRPITGVNLEPVVILGVVDERTFTGDNNYAGSDESMYSYFCSNDYCIKPYCRYARLIKNAAGKEYCDSHSEKCLYPDCEEMIPSDNSKIRLCIKHREFARTVCEECGHTTFDKECPCKSEEVKCKRCDRIIRDVYRGCEFCGSDEENWKEHPRKVFCDHDFDGEYKYAQVGKFGDDDFGHIIVGHCKKCKKDINEWEHHSFNPKGVCKCGYSCDHEYHISDDNKEICICKKCGNVSRHIFTYMDAKACYCTLCGYTAAHAYTYKDKAECECKYCGNTLQHDYECIDKENCECKYCRDNRKHDYTTTITYDYSTYGNSTTYGVEIINTHHIILNECVNCGYSFVDTGEHTFNDKILSDGIFDGAYSFEKFYNEKCTICGFTVMCVTGHYGGKEEYIPYSKEEHMVIINCERCGGSFTEYKNHYYINSKCYKCGQPKECIDESGHEKALAYDYDSYYYHKIIEYCTKCKVTLSENLERHDPEKSYLDGIPTPGGKCQKCSPIEGCLTEKDHVYNEAYDIKNSNEHINEVKCMICGKVKRTTSENHDWSIDYNYCYRCGYTKKCTDNDEHRYIYDYEYVSLKEHRVIERCANCGIEKVYITEHNVITGGPLGWLGIGTQRCNECGIISEKCKNGSVHICETTIKLLNDKEHSLIYTCGICGYTEEDKEKHDLYIYEGFSIRYQACRECDYYKKLN